MSTKILLVSEDFGESALLEEELSNAFAAGPDKINVLQASSENQARRELPGDVSLVITPLNIRQTASAPILTSERRGLSLIRWIASNQMKLPCILMAATYPDELNDSPAGTDRPYFVPTGGNLIERLTNLARKILQDKPSKFLDIEIQLRDRTHWSYQLTGKGFPYGHASPLHMDERMMLDVFEYSEDLGDPNFQRWKEKLKRTGDRLLDALWTNKDFIDYVFEGLEVAGGESKARVRFAVAPCVHGLALEALPCPRSREKYWMLEAPVYRRLLSDQPSTAGYLFEGGQRIESLIIESPASGMVQNPDLYLNLLPNVSEECRTLENWLKENSERFNLAEPVVLRAECGQPPLAARVQQALESREWGIVHYCGHSHYDVEKQSGFVFFPGMTEGSVDKVDIIQFSGWLRKAKFVYLSSCSSGAGPFMFELANRRVSNLVGFRWPIADDFASDYARCFYENLFAKRSFEQGFLKARQTMHAAHPDDRIWAAPLLIMQLGES